MGQGYGCTCNKCGYSFSANLGVGFLFPIVYKETVDAMKKGEYGEQGKKFFDDHLMSYLKISFEDLYPENPDKSRDSEN